MVRSVSGSFSGRSKQHPVVVREFNSLSELPKIERTLSVEKIQIPEKPQYKIISHTRNNTTFTAVCIQKRLPYSQVPKCDVLIFLCSQSSEVQNVMAWMKCVSRDVMKIIVDRTDRAKIFERCQQTEKIPNLFINTLDGCYDNKYGDLVFRVNLRKK